MKNFQAFNKAFSYFLQAMMLPCCLFSLPLVLFATPNIATQERKVVSFKTPEEAVNALVLAVKHNDKEKLTELLSPEIQTILETGETAYDQENRERFLKAYEIKHELEESGDKAMILAVGKSSWQFPIPLVKSDDGWHFDVKAGIEEIQNRRIGRNELSAMKALLAYVDAQREYFALNPEKNQLPSYAQKFMSTKGKRDGLYYPVAEGEKPSPLGELFANAQASGRPLEESDDGPRPYHGYYFRILNGQGPDASGGAYEYVVRGKMFGGHAAIAWPVSYGESGIMTFIVNHDGVIYEKNLGPDTAQRVFEITKFNPDKDWTRTGSN